MSEPASAGVTTDPDAVNIPAALLEAQRSVLEMIIQNQPLPDVLASLCRIVESQALRPVRAAILLTSPDGKRLTTGAAPGLPASYSQAIDGIEIARNVGTCAAAAARREVVVTPDIAVDPAWSPLRNLPLALGLKAAWSMPIVSATGAVLGTFGTYFLHKRKPTQQEQVLVEVLARTAALAIERGRAHDALRASESLHRAIVEASPECVKLVAADGTLLQINAAGLRMIEADDTAAVIGCNVFDAVIPEHRPAYREFHRRVCGGEAASICFEVVGLRGTRRTMESSAVPLAMAGGVRCQLSISRDATHRLASERALAQSHARLELSVMLSGIGFWHCDLPFGELGWDVRVKEHFFMAPDALVTIEQFFDRLHPEDRQPTREAIEASIHQRTPYDIIYRTVNPLSGEQKWIRALGGVVYGTDGTARQFDGVTVDVTAQKQDQQRLAELNAQLTEQDRRKDEFLATLAHELRNPLAPVRSGLEVLQRGGTPEQTARTRGMMERQLGHLVRMVDDLLDVSRITLGKSTLKMQPVDFHSVADSALETTRPLLAASGHDLEVKIESRPLPLYADATRLTQVLANLVSNAVRYTPSGGRIRLSASVQADQLIVTVSDTGIGIPPEMLPRVFDLFAQVYPALDSSQGGLGIGLTLAKRLTEMHGGSIQAESAGPGAGSIFTVSLPLATLPLPAAAPAQTTRTRLAAPLRILVVDDNVDAAESLAFLLELEGHETRVAHNGHAAVAAAEEFQPHVGLLDVGLPDISGHEVARRLRASTRLSDPLVLIALTGWGSEQDRRQAQAAGFDHHLVKPVELVHLLDVIGESKRH